MVKHTKIGLPAPIVSLAVCTAMLQYGILAGGDNGLGIGLSAAAIALSAVGLFGAIHERRKSCF